MSNFSNTSSVQIQVLYRGMESLDQLHHKFFNKAVEFRKTAKMLIKIYTPLFFESTRTNNGFLDNAYRGPFYGVRDLINSYIIKTKFTRINVIFSVFPVYRYTWRDWPRDFIPCISRGESETTLSASLLIYLYLYTLRPFSLSTLDMQAYNKIWVKLGSDYA